MNRVIFGSSRQLLCFIFLAKTIPTIPSRHCYKLRRRTIITKFSDPFLKRTATLLAQCETYYAALITKYVRKLWQNWAEHCRIKETTSTAVTHKSCARYPTVWPCLSWEARWHEVSRWWVVDLQLFEAAQQHLKMLYISELFLKVSRGQWFPMSIFSLLWLTFSISQPIPPVFAPKR